MGCGAGGRGGGGWATVVTAGEVGVWTAGCFVCAGGVFSGTESGRGEDVPGCVAGALLCHTYMVGL